MDIRLTLPASVECRVTLPASKSIANRSLIINALAASSLSCPAPVVSRQEHDIVTGINVGGAGTAMRFLTAFFAVQDGLMVVLDGDERMRQRPIAVLVDALRHLGAEIDYMGSEGYPPLRITGKHLTAGAITINPGVSSQYISALLMIAPLAGGMTLHLDGDPVSLPYIDMTLSLMRYHGIEARRNEHAIMVPAGHYTSKPPRIEGDWSAAAFWLALQALLPQSSITLQGLSCDSVQGDSAIQEIMEPLGVAVEKAKGIETQTFSQDDDELLCDDIEAMWQALVATGHTPSHPLCYRGGAEADVLMLSARAETGVLPEHYHRDMTATPDLVPILAVTLCLLRVPFTLVGLQTLRIKESDRVEALRQELSKLGYKVECDVNTMSYDGNHSTPAGDVTLDPHGDHRMVLALALAATRHPGITIKNAEVVTKSYPNFWKQLLLHPGT
ncbi:MAG: 3-phosphoshikimate 1-carboxyvinyltransferase [Bacteroidales bacterium]|nr:3-phosphoshikimate 1-carboxyvinyltransferase [Bacteroidales bacterium]